MTPHINAADGAFAETVLMPGDPLRAQYIAEHFMDDSKEVTNVRNMLGFTGFYRGHRVSVMGSGMGIPSASIYYTELVKEYGVRSLIRVGSCGAVSPDVRVRDVVVGMCASTDSNVNRIRFNHYDFSASADYGLLECVVSEAKRKGEAVKVGNLFSSDLFYSPDEELVDLLEKYGVLGVEMEAAGLYGVAAELGIRALAVCTVSDHIRTGEQLSSEERQRSFDHMISLVLDSAVQ
ncbi:Purine nucleoside phosphorylase DeoD-type [invertebrate metagenome]|uniref:Purine nucleoside phosphorylase DeoD-type n=1 Tax=invertebrate metagenome TaxID=1711999 RepID=A0A2H9T671_9ZZZZ